MTLMLAAVALAPGLALGSFLNVVAARVPLERSIVSPGSACMSCGHEIAWRDNVPVLSWLALRGRCRSCGVAIPARYPAVELVSALLVAGCVWRFGATAQALLASFFCLVLVAISATDLEHRIIPNRIVLPAFAVVLPAQTVLHPSTEWVFAALGASGFLFAAALAHPKGMGMGDVKLALLLGAMLGRHVGVAMLVGMAATLVVAVVLFVRHGVAARKTAVPFGPFLALGSVVALFAGGPLMDAYWALFR
ncbi:MAG TPA: prepilin peptidase [Gaiellaceae bacterium]|nr:prepilin peptidase [Gaiellaceae bacterium]